jgi:hypothetical protein
VRALRSSVSDNFISKIAQVHRTRDRFVRYEIRLGKFDPKLASVCCWPPEDGPAIGGVSGLQAGACKGDEEEKKYRFYSGGPDPR